MKQLDVLRLLHQAESPFRELGLFDAVVWAVRIDVKLWGPVEVAAGLAATLSMAFVYCDGSRIVARSTERVVVIGNDEVSGAGEI